MDEATTRHRAPSPSNTRKFVEADARSTDLLPKSSTSHARGPSTNFPQVRDEPEFILHDLAGPYPAYNSPSRPARRPTRHKTLPASGLGRPTRYKTLPAARLGGPPGTKLSQQAALAGPPGTKLSQRAALAGPPGTKLSQQAALAGPPGTKLSQRAPKCRFRAIFRMQGELFTASATNTMSREKKVTHQHPSSPQ